MNSPRQTVSFLIQRFREAGIRPVNKYGQNFLVDLNLVQLLVDAADIGPADVVLEIGTGTGSLTALIAEKAAAVVTVEVDRNLFQLASDQLLAYTNVTLLQQDALKNKNCLDPRLIAAVREQLQADGRRRLKLVANLPFHIATPIVSNLLSTEFLPVSMTVTIQKELAERITARPRCKDYSALSVWMQSQCDTTIIRIMPPSVFWPRPKVESAIIQIVPQPDRRNRIPDLAFFHTFVRAMFFHRRKFLRSELVSAFKDRLEKTDVDAVLGQQKLDPMCRAEELDVAELLALCEAVRARLAQDGRASDK